MMISPDCKKSAHEYCAIEFGNKQRCTCVCHVSKISPKSMQQEKDKHSITREDELRAEPVPWCHSESLIDIR
jgi:hypothetical protein